MKYGDGKHFQMVPKTKMAGSKLGVFKRKYPEDHQGKNLVVDALIGTWGMEGL